MKLFNLLLSTFIGIIIVINGLTYQANVWKAATGYPTINDFPENELLSDVFMKKKNVAIALSGGGVNAYASTTGVLAALHKLNLIKHIRYIGAVSGSSWAMAGYTYGQNIVSDDVYLGPIIQPENLTLTRLSEMNPNCIRRLLNASFYSTIIDFFSLYPYSAETTFFKVVEKAFFLPLGIKIGDYFSYNSTFVEDIISRNPTLSNSTFHLPVNKDRPFLLLLGVQIGPNSAIPYNVGNQNFSLIEFSPLYTGTAKVGIIRYKSISQLVGGYIEPFAFGSTPPSTGLLQHQTKGVLTVNSPMNPFGLVESAAVSSYAIGGLVASNHIFSDWTMKRQYWSPANSRPFASLTDFGDGAVLQNLPVIQFLQRKVSRIIAFNFCSNPLQPVSVWNVTADPFNTNNICTDISGYFGAIPLSNENNFFNYYNNQVFSLSDYFEVVKALQKAQQTGNGIIATFNLTTIENRFWGIPAGFIVEITFVLEGRVTNWENLLPPDMYDLMVPRNNSNLGQKIQTGIFKNFPHSHIFQGGDMSYELANLQASLFGWIVEKNKDLFISAISPNSYQNVYVPVNTVQNNRNNKIAIITVVIIVIIAVVYYYISSVPSDVLKI